jgi:hypothetical protein
MEPETERPRRFSFQLLCAFLLALFCAGACGQTFTTPNPGPGMVPITGTWQFHTGDDLAWANPAYDDSGWQAIRGDEGWGAQGHPGYTGYAWYRKRIDVAAGKTPLGIFISRTPAAYEVFWNGQRIGSVGSLPPQAHWYVYGNDAVFSLDNEAGAHGVLCLRFWAPPAVTASDPSAGGLRRIQQIGSLSLLRQQSQFLDYSSEHRKLPDNVAATLTCAAGMLSLLFYLRGSRQAGYLGLSLLLLGNTVGAVAGSLLHTLYFVSYQFLNQLDSSGVDIGLWLVLLSAFGLSGSRRWRVVTVIVLAVYLIAQCAEVAMLPFWQHAGPGLLRTDAIATQVYTVLELYPLFLVGFGLAHRRAWRFVPLGLLATLYNSYQPLAIFLIFIRPGMGNSFIQWHLQVGAYNFYLSTLLSWLLILTLVITVVLQQMEEGRRQAHLEQEIRSAQEVQQILIPEKIPSIPGLAVASVYKPASEVGGDFFQVIPPSPDEPGAGTLVIVGDVSGKGLKAAMTVSLIVGTLRTLAEVNSSPAAILAGLNRRLLGRIQGGFATCLVLRLDPGGNATLANAGHLAPFRDGLEWELPSSLPLGLTPHAEYEEVRTRLNEAETFTLITDGVLEARNSKGELYGFDRLATLMRGRPTAEQVADEACRFGQDDDITVLSITREAMTRGPSRAPLSATGLHTLPAAG